MGRAFLYKHLPEYIQKRRNDLGVTQQNLGEILGFSSGHQFISNIERGLCTLPIQHWKKVAGVLEIPLKDLEDLYLKDEERKVKYYLGAGK